MRRKEMTLLFESDFCTHCSHVVYTSLPPSGIGTHSMLDWTKLNCWWGVAVLMVLNSGLLFIYHHQYWCCCWSCCTLIISYQFILERLNVWMNEWICRLNRWTEPNIWMDKCWTICGWENETEGLPVCSSHSSIHSTAKVKWFSEF